MVKQLSLAIGSGLLGMVLFLRLFDGTATFLVQGWYRPILFASAAGLLGLSLATIVLAVRSGERLTLHGTPAGILTGVFVAVPLILGFVVKPQPLGSNSLDGVDASARPFGASVGSAEPGLRNIYQWAYEFQTTAPGDLAGQPVEIIGFVYHPKEGATDQFQVARFVVACCVADAQGFSLPVRWKDAAELPSDRWVRVKGRVAIGPDGAAIIQASEIERIEAPSNPYIYP